MHHPIRTLCACLGLAAGLGTVGLAAQDTTAVRTTTVTYLAGTSVYVGAGRADGLVEGQELQVIRRDAVAATLRPVPPLLPAARAPPPAPG